MDFAQLAKDNKALFGCYAAAIAAVVAWMVLVNNGLAGVEFKKRAQELRTVKKKINSLAKQVKATNKSLKKKEKPKDPLFTKADLKAFEKRREVAESNLKKLAEIYVERDKKLERWFDNWKDRPMDDPPEYGRYSAEYKEQHNKLVEEFQDLVGKAAESRLKPYPFDSSKDKMRAAQKVFWIRRALLEAMRKSKIMKLASDIEITGVKDGEGPFKLFSCRFEVEMHFAKLPVLVSEILRSEIPFFVGRTSVERVEFSQKIEKPARLTVNGTAPKRFFPEMAVAAHFPEGASTAKVQDSDLLKEPTVKVSLEVQAVDFDIKPPAKEESEDEDSGDDEE